MVICCLGQSLRAHDQALCCHTCRVRRMTSEGSCFHSFTYPPPWYNGQKPHHAPRTELPASVNRLKESSRNVQHTCVRLSFKARVQYIQAMGLSGLVPEPQGDSEELIQRALERLANPRIEGAATVDLPQHLLSVSPAELTAYAYAPASSSTGIVQLSTRATLWLHRQRSARQAPGPGVVCRSCRCCSMTVAC
jgi:hypothetical protein